MPNHVAQHADNLPTKLSDEQAVRQRRYTLFILVLIYTSSHVDRNILGILLEPIKQDLSLTDTQLGFLSGIAFAVFYATLGIPVARWADRGNRRNIIAWAVGIWSLMTALCGMATNFIQLALARIGVGIGEAGSTPPSHSMIADLYPLHKRSTAMAIYALGIYFGIMVGYFVGGWAAEIWGWRVAFFLVGLPGILLAFIMRYTITEPVRGYSDRQTVSPPHAEGIKKEAISQACLRLWQNRATRHIVIGATIASFYGYGIVTWVPSFLMRSHGMSLSEVGTFLAPVVGIMGGLGAYTGGALADKLAKKDLRWNAWVNCCSIFIYIPFFIGFLLVPNKFTAIALYAPAIFFSGFYLGPSFAMVQSLSPLANRALASALMLLIVNLIGLGLGPQFIGLLSDFYNSWAGVDSLRYALLTVLFINLWAAVHYYLAGEAYRNAIESKG